MQVAVAQRVQPWELCRQLAHALGERFAHMRTGRLIELVQQPRRAAVRASAASSRPEAMPLRHAAQAGGILAILRVAASGLGAAGAAVGAHRLCCALLVAGVILHGFPACQVHMP